MEDMMSTQQNSFLNLATTVLLRKSSSRTDASAASACHQVTTVLLDLTVTYAETNVVSIETEVFCTSFNDMSSYRFRMHKAWSPFSKHSK
jgi:hypothetical protein